MAWRQAGRQNYTPPDLVAKVTGKAHYAEDFRADGMLFAKLLLSPMPHARVRSIDTSEAMAMPGVKAILTADDVPDLERRREGAHQRTALRRRTDPGRRRRRRAHRRGRDRAHPRRSRAAARSSIDPLESLRPGGPNARLDGNVWSGAAARRPRAHSAGPHARRQRETLKWTARGFRRERRTAGCRWAQPPRNGRSAISTPASRTPRSSLDETFVVQSTGHHPMETRSAMAYWQNGKLYLHGSTQSVVRTVARHRALGRHRAVRRSCLICEYTGGGFGSKGAGAVSMAIPALLSKKANAPVMMRISREEESYIGRARTNMTGRAKIGFAKDGTHHRARSLHRAGLRALWADGRSPLRRQCRVADLSAGAMRWRAINVLTNTPPRTQQRSPGPMQANGIIEPVDHQGRHAARHRSGGDPPHQRARGQSDLRPAAANGQRRHVTSAFVKEALDRGAELFKWDERKARSGKRSGSKVRGVGVDRRSARRGLGRLRRDDDHPAGRQALRAIRRRQPRHAFGDRPRARGRRHPGMPWEKVEVIWGDTGKHLPYTCLSVGSQTTHAMTRANHAGAMDAKRKLQEIAAMDLGGSPDDYELGNERVYRRGNPARG